MSLKILSFVAVVLTSPQFIPQIVKAVKTKKVKDVSLVTFVITFIAALLWVIHGFARSDYPIVIANSIVFISSVLMLVFKYKYIN